MHFYKLLIYLLSLMLFSLVHADICRQLQSSLARSQSEYVFCSTTKSVPVELCSGCKQKYEAMEEIYDKLVKNQNCTHLFNNDRINILPTMNNILGGLWTKAYCDDCYHDNHYFEFDDKHTKLNNCLKQNENDKDICAKCRIFYTDLNQFYISLDQANHGKICYDMQDTMNHTLALWSKNLNCYQRKREFTLFIVTSSIFAFLPVVFYSSVYMLTKYQERNHGLLNEEEPELDAPSTLDLITAAILAAREPEPLSRPSKQPKQRIDDSSDDEQLQ